MSTIAVNAITDANDGNTTTINGVTPNSANVVGKNLIINGAMQIAQRGTSFTTDNVYTLDRWVSTDGTGGTPARTTTQETFSLGQTDVPNARYYLKHNQTGASTTGNAKLQQKVEDVTRFDGTTVTFSFYAKADSSLTVDVRLIQNFGTGGSPSTSVTVTETGISIGTSWNKYTVTKTLGSLSGKTLGTDGEHTSYLDVIIDFKETSTFIFEATLFQLEKGLSATEFEHRPYTTELLLCYRYYYQINSANTTREILGLCFGYDSDDGFGTFYIPVPMRGSISLSANDISLWLGSTVDSNTIAFVLHRQPYIGSTAIPINIDNTGSPAIGTRDCLGYGFNNTSAGYLKFDSEL
jgi:hypothetical protein